MTRVVLPGVAFWEFWAMCIGGCFMVGVLLTVAVLQWRKRKRLLAQLLHELPAEVGQPLYCELKIRPSYVLPLFIAILGLIGLWRFWGQSFASFAYDDQKLEMTYYNRISPVTLEWTRIIDLALVPDSQNRRRTAIAVYANDGRVYISRSARPRSAEAAAIDEAYQLLLKQRTKGIGDRNKVSVP